MILRPIARNEVADVWPVIEPFALQMEARFPDDWPIGETIRRATSGDMLLWLIWSDDEGRAYGVIGTEVQATASGKRILHAIMTAGYDHEKWAHEAERRLMAHARGNGCTECRISGRPGWAKAFPDWTIQRSVTMTKEVT